MMDTDTGMDRGMGTGMGINMGMGVRVARRVTRGRGSGVVLVWTVVVVVGVRMSSLGRSRRRP
jgi:hypothetical protein